MNLFLKTGVPYQFNYLAVILLVEFPGMEEREVWQQMAEDLAAEAVRRRCGDNVSVILMRLHE
ncbi:hypothetical protein ANCDUO_25618 [Ancylostoma duodenale]|uniref:PPM-type phosphatase domain-containing protein n=1 Tax=Ancylostoma duodenale TaxID=51022 RepID=A0A0C2C3W7_9BILA|nr:hypothetical protein ANCDUO_25618 [Ancylostoma duodenale]